MNVTSSATVALELNPEHVPSMPRTKSITAFGPISPKDSITTALSQKELVIQLRQLAQDPQQQQMLITNEQCLIALTEILNTNNVETCIAALQTLQFLAYNPKYRSVLIKVPHLIAKVHSLSTDESKDERLLEIAQLLEKTVNTKISKEAQQTFKPRALQTIEMQIVNLNNEKEKDEIQQIGIKINGIISISVNMQTKSVTFYCTKNNLRKKVMTDLKRNGFIVSAENDESLGNNVVDTMSVHSGVSNFTDHRRGNLSSLQFSSSNNSTSNQLSANVVSGASYIQPNLPTANRTGITRYGTEMNTLSLAQRLTLEQEKKQAEEEKINESQSVLSKIIGYIW